MTTEVEVSFPGYDVLSKRNGLSWNDATRKVIDERLAVVNEPRYFSTEEWQTLVMLCRRIVPQPEDRQEIPLAAYIDREMLEHGDSGTRIEPMPYDGEAWRRALAALDAEAQAAHQAKFHTLSAAEADALLMLMQKGDMTAAAWGDIPPKLFFSKRILVDIPAAYYAHPAAWNELGFGGPASPRGYVRMAANRRDPWEATQAAPGQQAVALRDNRNVR